MSLVPAHAKTKAQSHMIGEDPVDESLDARVVQTFHPLAHLETCK